MIVIGIMCIMMHRINLIGGDTYADLTRHWLGYPATFYWLGGRPPPSIPTFERMVAERRGKRKTRALNKANLKTTYFFLK